MTRRRRSTQLRLVPVWRPELDREALLRALLLMTLRAEGREGGDDEPVE